jgi:hypothetical protein
MIELLSDLGRIHDDIKAIPGIFKLSMADSLEIIAQAVEDAETTAQKLQEATKEAIQATSSRVAFEAGSQLSDSIQQSMQRTFEPALTKAASNVDDLGERLKAVGGKVRETHATRFNFIVLGGVIAGLLIMMGAMAWLAILTQENSDTNKWFYNEYKSQRAIIEGLPPELKRKFDHK